MGTGPCVRLLLYITYTSTDNKMNSGIVMDSLGHVTAPRHQKMRCVHRFPFRTKALTPQGLGVLGSKLWLVIAKYLLPYWPWLKTISFSRSTVLSQKQHASNDWQWGVDIKKSGLWFNLIPLYRARLASELPMELAEAFAVTVSLLKFLFLWWIPILYSPVNSLHSNQNMDGVFYSVATYNVTLNKSQQWFSEKVYWHCCEPSKITIQ